MPRFAGEPTTNHALARAVRADTARFQKAVDEHVRELGSFAVSDHYVTDAGLPLGKWFAKIRATRRPARLAAVVDAQIAWRWPTPSRAPAAPWGEVAAALSRLEQLFALPAGGIAARHALQGNGSGPLPGYLRTAAALLQADYHGAAASMGLKQLLERWKVRSWRVASTAVSSEHRTTNGRVHAAMLAPSEVAFRVMAAPATTVAHDTFHLAI
jgi:hypothetical protein